MPFDPGFVTTLERLNLLARRVYAGDARGDRESLRKGASLEFADYRAYTPGDDLRYVDWNAYARFGHLYVKEYAAEENVHAAIVLDTSASMTFGEPSKLETGRRVAAALGYIGLANLDSVSLYGVSDAAREAVRFLRGKQRIFELLDALDRVPTGGATSLRRALESPLPRLKGRAMALLLSDFFDPDGYEAPLRALRAQEIQVHALHLVADEELAPRGRGRHRLTDLETGRTRDVFLSEATLARYRRAFEAHCGGLEKFCAANEMPYVRIQTGWDLEKIVTEIVRRGGVLGYR